MHEQTTKEYMLLFFLFILLKSVHIYLFGEFWGGGGENMNYIQWQNLHTIGILRSLYIKEELKHFNP